MVVRGDNLDFTSTSPLAWMKGRTFELKNMPSKEHFIIVNPEEIGKTWHDFIIILISAMILDGFCGGMVLLYYKYNKLMFL